MKFERIKPGMTLYDVHSYRMGNTTIRSWGVWRVIVESVDAEKRTAVVRWNEVNRPETWTALRVSKLREKEPEMVTGFFGSQRPLRRGEKAKP